MNTDAILILPVQNDIGFCPLILSNCLICAFYYSVVCFSFTFVSMINGHGPFSKIKNERTKIKNGAAPTSNHGAGEVDL